MFADSQELSNTRMSWRDRDQIAQGRRSGRRGESGARAAPRALDAGSRVANNSCRTPIWPHGTVRGVTVRCGGVGRR